MSIPCKIEAKIDDLVEKIDELRTKTLPGIKTDIALLKYKSSIWGGVAGVIGTVLTAVGYLLMRGG